MATQIRGTTQIKDNTIDLIKLEADFLNGADWNITNGNNDATITGVQDPVNAQDVATKTYVDGLVDASLKLPEAYDPTVTSNYPLTYSGSAIQAGDSFRITGADTLGTVDVNSEDLLIALIDNPGVTTDADWMVAESNRTQATETALGVSEIATQAEVNAEVDDLRYITPAKLGVWYAANEVKTTEQGQEDVTNGIPVLTGVTIHTLTQLGTHATDKVTFVKVYMNGLLQKIGDVNLNKTTGVISMTFDTLAGDTFSFVYSTQNA